MADGEHQAASTTAGAVTLPVVVYRILHRPPPSQSFTNLHPSPPARATKLADVARAAAGGCAMPDPTSARTSATLRSRIRQRLPRGEYAGIAPWVNARNGVRGTNVAYPVSRGTRCFRSHATHLRRLAALCLATDASAQRLANILTAIPPWSEH